MLELLKEFAKNFYGLLADVNKAVPQNKLNQLAEWFGIFESNKNLSLEGFMRHSVSDILYTRIRWVSMRCRSDS